MTTAKAYDDRHLSKQKWRSRSLWTWFRFNSVWFVPLVFAIALVIYSSVSSINDGESRMTGLVDMGQYGASNLEIEIQYPATLTKDTSQGSNRQIIVLPKGQIGSSLNPVALTLQESSGAVHFVDSAGRIADGKLTIFTDNERPLPNEIHVAYAGTRRGDQGGPVTIDTFLTLGNMPAVSVPELQLEIDTENQLERTVREFANSAFGGAFTLAAFAIATIAFAFKQYVTRKRISPYEDEINRLTGLNHWDEVADYCQRILEIDPLYDHVGARFNDAQARAHAQRQQLDVLLHEARRAVQDRQWTEAKEKLQEILRIRPDDQDARQLAQQVEFESKKQAKVESLLREASWYNIEGKLDLARRRCQEALEIDSQNSEALRTLEAVDEAIRKFGAERLTPEMFRGYRALALYAARDGGMVASVLERPEGEELLLAIASLNERIPQAILDSLHDERRHVRINALRVISQSADERSVDYLRDIAAKDPDLEVREMAFHAWLEKTSIDELIAGLTDPSTWRMVREEILARGRETIPYLVPLLLRPTPLWQRAEGIIVDLGEEARQSLIEMLPVADPSLRKRLESILSAL